ncbi:hypothetical protein BASA62_006823 [Batrachochytrium salamandrivorans]|nr:hypothetical protein BASA62_006823 [Batrachochytrium salamandrivorans]
MSVDSRICLCRTFWSHHQLQSQRGFASIRQALDRVVPFRQQPSCSHFRRLEHRPTAPSAHCPLVGSWLTVMQFSGSQITRLSTVHGRRHSSIDHFVCNAPARALLTSPRVDRQTAVADHFVIRTSIRAEAQGQPPVPRAPTISRHHCLEATDRIATSNYWDVLADVQCNTLRDEWSRLKAAATQLERVDGRKQWVKHADNLDRAVSDGRTDLVFAAARAMSGNSSRSAAVTPLYNSNGIVQYDPTSILRVMQGHYGSLAADTTGHSLDFLNGEADLDQCWLDGTVEHESMGTRHDNRALAARLADFPADNDVFTLNVQGQLVRSQRWFWSRRTKQLYRNRYWLTPQVRPKTVKQRHSFALMETLQTCGDSASLQKYVTRQLLDTSGFFKDPSFDQSRAHGTRYLMLARMDALWTARKAIQIGILVDTHPFSVDHCILCDQQLLSTSIAHLVVECEQVTGHRIQSGLVPAIQKSRLRLLGRALDPGVENVYTWLRGGVLNGEADLDQQWLDGTVEHESMGTRHDNRALAARLADFLQVAYRQYQSTLWKYHRDRLVEVG